MANRVNGETSVEVGGKRYTFHLTTSAVCEVEDLLSTPERDVPFSEVISKANRQSMRHIRAILWGALRAHHPEMTLDDVSAFIDQLGGPEGQAVLKQVGLVGATTVPDMDDVETVVGKEALNRPRRAQAKAGTGARSTPRRGASV